MTTAGRRSQHEPSGSDAVGYHCTFNVAGDIQLSFEYFCYEIRQGRAIASVGFPASVPTDERDRILGDLTERLKSA